MSGYNDLTKLETSRNCLRRIARHDEQQFSKDSIVNVMEKFVKTVNIMDDTILVPCRLMDRQIGDNSDIIGSSGKDSTANQLLTKSTNAQGKRGVAHSKNVHEFLSASELFNLYSMLNALKNDLLWTGNQSDAEADDADPEVVDLVSMKNVIVANTSMEQQSTSTTATTISLDRVKSELSAAGDNLSVNRQSSTVVAAAAAAATTTTTAAAAATATTCATSTGTGTGTGTGIGPSVKGHMRRTSTASMASTTSVSNLSDSDSDISNENDSGLESDGNKSDHAQSSDGSSSASSEINACKKSKAANMDKATDLAKRCRRHLNGLYQCLEQMTEAANYLTARYQSDIGPV